MSVKSNSSLECCHICIWVEMWQVQKDLLENNRLGSNVKMQDIFFCIHDSGMDWQFKFQNAKNCILILTCQQEYGVAKRQSTL